MLAEPSGTPARTANRRNVAIADRDRTVTAARINLRFRRSSFPSAITFPLVRHPRKADGLMSGPPQRRWNTAAAFAGARQGYNVSSPGSAAGNAYLSDS